MKEAAYSMPYELPYYAVAPFFAVSLDSSADVADAIPGLGRFNPFFQALTRGLYQVGCLLADLTHSHRHSSIPNQAVKGGAAVQAYGEERVNSTRNMPLGRASFTLASTSIACFLAI